MARALAFAASLPRSVPIELARVAIVSGCALALILAGQMPLF
ncbi:hypothetical protein [Novosphingobium sp. Gsoil 351]|nr:hypothetical protein [Novosphingobium sp. Gsoil 351]